MHPCNPSLCDYPYYTNIPASEELNNDDFIADHKETNLDNAEFAYFEIKFLYIIFIMMNTYQVMNAMGKLFKKNNGKENGGIYYIVLLNVMQFGFLFFLAYEFPEVFAFQIRIILYTILGLLILASVGVLFIAVLEICGYFGQDSKENMTNT